MGSQALVLAVSLLYRFISLLSFIRKMGIKYCLLHMIDERITKRIWALKSDSLDQDLDLSFALLLSV